MSSDPRVGQTSICGTCHRLIEWKGEGWVHCGQGLRLRHDVAPAKPTNPRTYLASLLPVDPRVDAARISLSIRTVLGDADSGELTADQAVAFLAGILLDLARYPNFATATDLALTFLRDVEGNVARLRLFLEQRDQENASPSPREAGPDAGPRPPEADHVNGDGR